VAGRVPAPDPPGAPTRGALLGGLLDGVNAASLALMAVVSWRLGRAALVNP